MYTAVDMTLVQEDIPDMIDMTGSIQSEASHLARTLFLSLNHLVQ